MESEQAKILKVESELVRWEIDRALFRVRLVRSDGAVAEAHGGAAQSESGDFAGLAEDRARQRAFEALGLVGSTGEYASLLPAAQHAARLAVPLPDLLIEAPPTHATPQTVRTDHPVRTVVSDIRPTIEPVITDAATPRAAYTLDDDPFSDEVPFADEPSFAESSLLDEDVSLIPEEDLPGVGDESPASGDQPPKSGSRAPSPQPAQKMPPGHIRPEAGGSLDKDPPAASTPRHGTGAAPSATGVQRCSRPGCGQPLTKAQMTVSTHKHGKPLCARHMREHGA